MALEDSVAVPGTTADREFTLGAAGNPPFHVSISQMEDRCLMVLSGELDVSTAPLLREHLVEVTADVKKGLVLDIGLLTFIDSTGISLLVSEHKRLQAQGSSLTVFSPTPMTRRLFEISGLTSFLSIVPDLAVD